MKEMTESGGDTRYRNSQHSWECHSKLCMADFRHSLEYLERLCLVATVSFDFFALLLLALSPISRIPIRVSVSYSIFSLIQTCISITWILKNHMLTAWCI